MGAQRVEVPVPDQRGVRLQDVPGLADEPVQGLAPLPDGEEVPLDPAALGFPLLLRIPGPDQLGLALQKSEGLSLLR